MKRQKHGIRPSALGLIPLFFTIGLFCLGIWQFGGGLYIAAKAELAQILLHNAWLRTLDTGSPQKPWPWADTWPVARLQMADIGVDMIILEGVSGEAMAFGPGQMAGLSAPGEPGLSIFAAHRDTHFAFLENIEIGQNFLVETQYGEKFTYRIIDVRIVHYREARFEVGHDQSTLVLVTCYPFDALRAGSPLRYVVIGEMVPFGEKTL